VSPAPEGRGRVKSSETKECKNTTDIEKHKGKLACPGIYRRNIARQGTGATTVNLEKREVKFRPLDEQTNPN